MCRGSEAIVDYSLTMMIVKINFLCILKVQNLDQKPPEDIRMILSFFSCRTIRLHPNEELLLFVKQNVLIFITF